MANVSKLVKQILTSPTYVSDPNAGHGVAGIVISPDPVGGGLIMYSATDTYDPELGTGTYQILMKLSDGKLYAGTGYVILDSGGVRVGAVPPTSPTVGTGIIIDSTGLYGLASNSQQVVIDATTGRITAINATITGTITATAGAIGGWTIGATTLTGGSATLSSTGVLTLGTSNDVVILDAADATYRLWIGNATAASAPFRVTKAGAVTATSGTVGGWTISSTSLGNSGSTVLMRSAGNLAFGSTPPTSATVGTGLFLDSTGLYGLNANTQEAIFSASTGKITAGAGEVTLDSNGVSLTSGAGDTNQVKWYSGATKIMSVMTSANDATFGSYGRFYVYNSPSVAKASLFFAVGEVDTGPITQLTLISTTAGDRYAAFHSNGTTFQGLAVTNAIRFSPSSLLHLKAPAPTFRMEDTGGNDLLVTVSGNKAVFEEAAGTDVMILDLANARVGIANASPTVALDVTGAGLFSGALTTNGAFTSIGIDDNSNGLAVTIDTTERFMFGYATSIGYRAAGSSNTIQVANANTNNSIAGFQAIRFSNDTGGARLTLGKSRDTTPGNHTVVQSGDELALFDFIADDGTLHLAAASIVAKVDGTPGTNDMPGRLEFYVTADGAAAPTLAMTINNDKSATFKNFIKSDSATAGIGYATGAGGTVTQATSKSTGVTLSKVVGQITMNNAALAGDTTVSFTLTNTAIAATDILVLNHVSGGTAGSYLLNSQCAAGSASINVRNITTGSLSEAIVIGFVVFKGVTS